jgi:hypothetical protein
MADHQFEQKVSQQLAGFKLKPNAEVWQQVETQLEEDRRRRRWFFYLPIAALLIGGLLYAVWPVEEPAKPDTAVQSNTNKTNTTTVETNTNESPLTKTGSSTTTTETATVKKQNDESRLNEITNKSSIAQQPVITKRQVEKQAAKQDKKNAAGTNKNQPIEVISRTDKTVAKKEPPAENVTAAIDTKQPVEHVVDSIAVDQSAEIKTDKAPTIESTTVVDTNSIASAELTPTIAKKKWQIGLHVSTGLSDIRGSLFPGSGFKSFSFSDVFAPTGSNNGTQGGVTRIVQYEYAVKPSLHFGTGVLLRKPFKKRNSLITGLQYQYSSYSVKQRQRIDTFILANNYFSNISIKEKTVQFRMHALNVPLELELKIADIKKGTLLLNAGIQNWFVVSSTQTDTLSGFRYAATTERAAGYSGTANAKETKATAYQPQLYLSPAFEWRGKKTSSQLGLYLDYGLRPVYKSSAKDYWWQTGIRYRIYFNR